MKVSKSIEIIWHLAGSEAIAADFGELEPEHFMIAILQFVDQPLFKVEKVVSGSEAIKALKSDIKALKAELEEKKMDPRVVRRELRKAMGKGENPYEGKQLHRTPATREIFDKAARLASDSHSDTLMAKHLLSILMETPSPVLAQVIAGCMEPSVKAEPKQPLRLLYEYATDLKSIVMNDKSWPEDMHVAAARAVLRVLGSNTPNSVFLVTDDVKMAKAVILAVTRMVYSKNAPNALKGKRLLDLSEIKPDADSSRSDNDLFENLLIEASSTPGFILYLPAVLPSSENQVPWADTLQNLAAADKIQFAAPMPHSVSAKIKRDPVWKRIAHFVTVSTRKTDAIPLEL